MITKEEILNSPEWEISEEKCSNCDSCLFIKKNNKNIIEYICPDCIIWTGIKKHKNDK